VKLRGYRIELGEIESELQRHQMVEQSVVAVVNQPHGEKVLVAYVVPREISYPPKVSTEMSGENGRVLPATKTSSFSVTQLRDHLKASLPEYMIPSAFVFLNSLPLTPNGKVDRRALPSPNRVRPELDVTYVAPDSETERRIMRIWEETLQIEKPGLHDNFFDLGGNSLLLVRVHSQLRKLFDLDISLVEMFRHPTIHLLARLVSQGGAADSKPVEKAQSRAGKQANALSSQKEIMQSLKKRNKTKVESGGMN